MVWSPMAETGPQQRITIRGEDPPFFQCIYACAAVHRDLSSVVTRLMPVPCHSALQECFLARARCSDVAKGRVEWRGIYTVTAQLASFADNSAAASPRPPGAGGQLTSTEERRGSVRSENLGNLNGSEKVSGKRPHLPAQTWPV